MKVAVSIPDEVFEAVDRLARRMKKPRSRVYAEALEQYVDSHNATAIKEKLDAVYAVQSSALDPGLAAAQQRALKREAW